MTSSFQSWRRLIMRQCLGDKLSASLYGKNLSTRLQVGQSPGLNDNRVLQAAERLVSLGDVVIDVGALGGDWSYKLGCKVGSLGWVFGVEADPFFACVLKAAFRNLHMAQVRIEHTALGDAERTAWLATKSEHGRELLGFAHIEPVASNRSLAVPMTTLDALCRIHPRLSATRLLKIDTEGYEPFILQGGKQFLLKVRPVIICEINSQWLARFGWSPSRILSLLSELGYKPVAANGNDVPGYELDKRFKNDSEFSDDIMFQPVEK